MNDIEMLNCIAQGAEMGCQGVTAVRKRIRNGAVDQLLLSQMTRYGKIYHAAGLMLRNRGENIRHISPIAKKMTRLSAEMDLRRDSTPSHVAEMMIKGSTMGVNKLVHSLRSYDRTDPTVTLLAKKLLDTEEEHIRELRTFV
ncbi:MAG: hypothetical protein IJH96_00735 [Ruminococcus sp.]|nr:hypothetical protein [Ruminococcus sp.]